MTLRIFITASVCKMLTFLLTYSLNLSEKVGLQQSFLPHTDFDYTFRVPAGLAIILYFCLNCSPPCDLGYLQVFFLPCGFNTNFCRLIFFSVSRKVLPIQPYFLVSLISASCSHLIQSALLITLPA